MARYEHLPIYKTAMDLTAYLEQVVRNFSRYHKYTLGSDLRQQRRELVLTIIRANSRRDKLPVLYELRERRIDLAPVIQPAVKVLPLVASNNPARDCTA